MKGQSLTSMNISIPSALRERLEEKLVRRGYGSASEYVRQLIRQDLERDARDSVEALLLEGVNSKKRVKATSKWLEEKKALVRSAARRSGKRT